MARRENFITKANGRDAALQEIYQNRQMVRDEGLVQQGDMGALFRTFARRFPQIVADEEMLADARYGVDERLEMGEPNVWETYEKVGRDVLSDYAVELGIDPDTELKDIEAAYNPPGPGDPDPYQINRTHQVIDWMAKTRAQGDDLEAD